MQQRRGKVATAIVSRCLFALTVCFALASVAARAELVGHGGAVKGIAVTPDGHFAVSASFDYSLIVWNLDELTLADRLYGHDAAVNAVAILPDGRHAITGSDDGTVGLWNLARRQMIDRLTGHTGKVAAVAVSPDGGMAASAGWDGTVRLWDLSRRQPLRVLRVRDNAINAVAFSPDGSRVLARHRMQLAFDPAVVSPAELIARISAQHAIKDLFVENPPIERIIAELYAQYDELDP